MLADTSHSLICRLKADNSGDDWNVFVKIYRPFIMGYLRRCDITGQDADDVCQNVLTQVVQGIARFEHNDRVGAFRTWLRKIARQRIWEFIHSRQKSNRLINNLRAFNSEDDVGLVIDEHWDREHDRYVVNRLLQLIRPEFTHRTWESFRAVVLGSEKPAAVANRLGVTANSVLIAKSRIMKRLRETGDGLIDSLE